ncbi:GNAT family N-acetyltransferase [archaeon]|jgi:diamine N-acetyltransferase|nr:GNAT family N-acetyltransferase [archaeon]MBT7128152.1 GNAT family N-acetyltransferase [archaeon]MBT7281883.1 GNAT family N-acetyltransferase [archaeon]
MATTIRKATMKDLKKIQELNLELFKKEKKEYDSLLDLDWVLGKDGIEYYKNRISKDNSCVLVSIVDGKIVGYLCGELGKTGAYRRLSKVIPAYLETIFILEEFRSKKIGKKLYDKFIEWCKTKNVSKAMLDVSTKNKLAIKFYRKNKFVDYSLTLETDL